MSERATPFYCPYCGDEDLRPHEGGPHAAWLCAGCRRVFTVKLVGLNLVRPGDSTNASFGTRDATKDALVATPRAEVTR